MSMIDAMETERSERGFIRNKPVDWIDELTKKKEASVCRIDAREVNEERIRESVPDRRVRRERIPACVADDN